MSHHIATAVQIAGSLLILVPFLLVQLQRLSTTATSYVVLNLVGSTILAVDAWHWQQWGFLLLEATWALVSLMGLIRRSPVVAH